MDDDEIFEETFVSDESFLEVADEDNVEPESESVETSEE